MDQPNLTRALFLGLSTLALAAMGAAPAAAAADASACTPASTAAVVSADGSLEEAVETSDGIGAASTCTADCWDGSTVTCDGSSCSAVNSDCDPNMVRGYCEADGTKKHCPPCEECRATASCLNGSSVSCTGQSHCAEVNSCYAFCDGVEYWCFDADPNTCPVFN